MSSKYAVVGLGNALMDALIQIPSDRLLQEEGLNKGIMHPVDHERWMEVYNKIDHSGVTLQTGGSCANTIAALGFMGAKVSYCGHVGDDDFGETYANQLETACGQHNLVFGHGNTGKCLSLVSQDAERTMLTDLGSSVLLPSVDDFAKTICSSQVFYSTGYLLLGDPMLSRLKEAASIAKENGVLVALDVADPFVVSAVTDLMKEFIEEYCDMVFLNEEEAKAITGTDDATNAITDLQGICSTIVVKLGSKGAVVYSNGTRYETGVFPVDPIDTTGAGDSFAAGFLYGWTNDFSIEDSLKLAARVAAETIVQLGAVVRGNRLKEIRESI
jgi:sugar/nucleoside kinase (ribokinase family)